MIVECADCTAAAYVIALTAYELAPALVLRLVRLLFLVLISMTVAPLPQEYGPVRNIRGGVKTVLTMMTKNESGGQ